MSFTITFDASLKVKRGPHAKNLFRHIARDVDQAADHYFPQRNVNIVPARTPLNVTRVNDGAGGFRWPVTIDGRPPSDEFDDYLKHRLRSVHRPLRRDAVLMRPIVLQLDPTWFATQNSDWRENHLSAEARRYMAAAMDWVCAEFGQPNVVGWSLHLDEYHPQIQVLMTPVTEDGRLSQMEFFKGRHDLKRQHSALRAAVAASGYDVEHRVTERSREHLSSSDFQTRADRLRAGAMKLDLDIAETEAIAMRLRSRVSVVDNREAELASREREAAAAREALQQALLRAREAEQSARRAQANAVRALDDANSERSRLEQASARLESLPPYFERWLDRTTSKDGTPLRERFDRDRAKMRRQAGAPIYNDSMTPTKPRPGVEY